MCVCAGCVHVLMCWMCAYPMQTRCRPPCSDRVYVAGILAHAHTDPRRAQAESARSAFSIPSLARPARRTRTCSTRHSSLPSVQHAQESHNGTSTQARTAPQGARTSKRVYCKFTPELTLIDAAARLTLVNLCQHQRNRQTNITTINQ